MLTLQSITKFDPALQTSMASHYSQPKGFVGRSICYAILWNDLCYGHIVGGSAPKYLPGRNEFFGASFELQSVIDNIFYHVEKINGAYPCRWFTVKVLEMFRQQVVEDWKRKYGSYPIGFESLVELPRTGAIYIKDGWTYVGTTKGQTCKRVAGKGTDSWSGKRVWNTKNLRPKLVFCKLLS